jgi:hypothetical protein
VGADGAGLMPSGPSAGLVAHEFVIAQPVELRDDADR